MRILGYTTTLALLIIILLIAGSNAWILHQTRRVVSSQSPKETWEYAIVLGAGVRGKRLSDALKGRMTKAVDLYTKKRVRRILISGDGTDRFYNEPKAMLAFAQSHAVPEATLVVDNRGYSTYATMVRARDQFGVTSALIVSQSYHVARAVWIARSLGIQARGVAVQDPEDSFMMHAREVLARSKDFFWVLLDVEPSQERDTLF